MPPSLQLFWQLQLFNARQTKSKIVSIVTHMQQKVEVVVLFKQSLSISTQQKEAETRMIIFTNGLTVKNFMDAGKT